MNNTPWGSEQIALMPLTFVEQIVLPATGLGPDEVPGAGFVALLTVEFEPEVEDGGGQGGIEESKIRGAPSLHKMTPPSAKKKL